MKKLLDSIRVIQKTFDKNGYICKNHEGNPFYGEIHITIVDGKITYSRNKSNGDVNVIESVKI